MAITGAHALLYTSEPEAARAILRDVFGWAYVDDGDGWLIFALPPAELKLKDGGGLAGHNGLRSVTSHLHTQDYLRVRIGVGKPPDPRRGADHVLKRLGKAEREQMDVTLELAADAVEGIVADGMAATMNRVNTRPKP